MAFDGTMLTLAGLEAAADLSAAQYFFVKIDAAGKVALDTSDGLRSGGVLQNKPSAAGHAAEVVFLGQTKMVAGAAVAAGDQVMVQTATGKAVTATSGKFAMGIALTAAAADGDILSVLLLPTETIA